MSGQDAHSKPDAASYTDMHRERIMRTHGKSTYMPKRILNRLSLSLSLLFCACVCGVCWATHIRGEGTPPNTIKHTRANTETFKISNLKFGKRMEFLLE